MYNNGCNHAHCCLNREPAFFKHMQQLIDATHYKAHTKCPSSFDTTPQQGAPSLPSDFAATSPGHQPSCGVWCALLPSLTFPALVLCMPLANLVGGRRGRPDLLVCARQSSYAALSQALLLALLLGGGALAGVLHACVAALRAVCKHDLPFKKQKGAQQAAA